MDNDGLDDSVAMFIPKEYFAEFAEVIRKGLQEARISREARSNLTGWWKAVSSLIEDTIQKQTEK